MSQISKKKLAVVCALAALGVVAVARQDVQAVIGNVFLQDVTPGLRQSGHANIGGTFRAGQVNVTQGTATTIPVIGNNTAVGPGTAMGGSFSSSQLDGIGVRGTSAAPITGGGIGVYGEARSEKGAGVKGRSVATNGGFNDFSAGVFGEAVHQNVPAVRAKHTNGTALLAQTSATGLSAVSASNTHPTGGFGVSANSNFIGIKGYGGFAASMAGSFQIDNLSATGLEGQCGRTQGGTGVGVSGVNPNANGWAVFAEGRLGATGTKLFTIDHPLDPENMTLSHYCTEGEEPLNVYRGTVRTGANARATIRLPRYFDAINTHPTVQLTVEDSSEEFVLCKVTRQVDQGQFEIRTSKPGAKVFWRVEARRNDKWVQRHGSPVEVSKPEYLRGYYLQPDLYGQPRSKGRNAAVHNAALRAYAEGR